MLSRAEESGGNRTVKLARATAGSPPAHSSPYPPSRNTSGNGSATRPRARSSNSSSGSQLLHSVGLAEFLQLDDRPIFVVDPVESHPEFEVHLVFANSALKKADPLLDCIQGTAIDPEVLNELGTPFTDFRAWLLTQLADGETIDTFPYAGYLWKSAVIRRRLKVVTGQSLTSRPVHVGPESYTTSPLPSPMPRLSIDTAGYFESRNSNHHHASQAGVDEFAASPHTPIETAPTPSGDLTHSNLLASPLSPEREQIASHLPARRLSGLTEEGLRTVAKGFFDWTRLPMQPHHPQHIQFARNIDWASTSLGSIESWPSDLRAMCNLIMASPHPAAMYWGPDHVAIYNEPYILLAGQKHPKLMGSRYRDAWIEIWDALKDVFDNAYNHAQATMKDDDCLFITRNGFLEETYFSWSIIPLIGADGSVVGLYNPAFEKTRRKVAERRMLTLREIGERTSAAREVSQFWNLLLEGLSFNELDVPLVMVYSLGNDHSEENPSVSGSSSSAASKTARLEGTLGVEMGHPAAPPVIDLKTSNLGFAWTFRQALTQNKPIVLREDDGTLDTSLLEGISWRGFGDPSKVIVACPIHPTTGDSTLGFLVIGTNPRRPFDEDFDLFIQLLARQLATSVASVVLFEEEIKKGERLARLAAQDRIEMNRQLVARTQEAVEAENKFTRMAELAPVGMFIGDSKGRITFVNDAWYQLSSYPRDVQVLDDWIYYIVEEDQPKAWKTWTTMLSQKCNSSAEFRFKTPWRENGGADYTWVIASASPEKDEDGNITRVFGSVTDISSQKFAEKLQTKRMDEAIEMKRQQERYIDTTSHELRNPLSAILQSADFITDSLTEMNVHGLSVLQRELLNMTIESSQVISLCAQHQKRIVDDVLTLSKLDSAMMAVTPVDVQPVSVVERTLKMFEGECRTADIELDFSIEDSYTDLKLDWVKIDPHRLSQVLINLTTNAIKFTTGQEKRKILVKVAASTKRPSADDKWGLTFISTKAPKDRDVTSPPEWGLGESLYLHFAVQDSGRGLTELEKNQLFQRFSQANPRTHVHYGGSGLGLFISRELVELQGGAIGVSSEAGKGSIFAFYIKARRSDGPPGTDEDSKYPFGQPRKPSRGHKVKIKPQAIQSDGSSPTTSSNITSISPTSTSFQKSMSVLIVEDNIINQKVLASQLRKVGCTVYVANHGAEAIEIIKTSNFYRHSKSNTQSQTPSSSHTALLLRSPSSPSLKLAPPSPVNSHTTHQPSSPLAIDVVLMDLEMPVMDGLSCSIKLRDMQSTGELVAHVPVIAVTANARAEQIRGARESGVDDVVSKPFRVHELMPRMREVVERFGVRDGDREDGRRRYSGIAANSGDEETGREPLGMA
jgi:PAS domain S-box-containing protein